MRECRRILDERCEAVQILSTVRRLTVASAGNQQEGGDLRDGECLSRCSEACFDAAHRDAVFFRRDQEGGSKDAIRHSCVLHTLLVSDAEIVRDVFSPLLNQREEDLCNVDEWLTRMKFQCSPPRGMAYRIFSNGSIRRNKRPAQEVSGRDEATTRRWLDERL
jgi:hypothetical protein